MGDVFEGLLEHTQVAIKALKMRNASVDLLGQMKKEAFIMAGFPILCIRHPNIVQLHGICMVSPHSLIMEYLPNGSLFDWLHSDRPLDWPQRIRIAKDVAAGLAFLHKRGVMHRDIKSLNVLLDANLMAKLSDYGLAKIKSHISTTTNPGMPG